jgi:hypothetical protein
MDSQLITANVANVTPHVLNIMASLYLKMESLTLCIHTKLNIAIANLMILCVHVVDCRY